MIAFISLISLHPNEYKVIYGNYLFSVHPQHTCTMYHVSCSTDQIQYTMCRIQVIQSLFIILIITALAVSLLLYQKESVSLSSLPSIQTVISSPDRTNGRRWRVQNIFKTRMEKIREVCEEEKENIAKVRKVNVNIWSVERAHGLVMCRTAKHGSTTWANYFVQMYIQRWVVVV